MKKNAVYKRRRRTQNKVLLKVSLNILHSVMQTKNPFFCSTVNETEKVISLNRENMKNLHNWELLEFTKCLKDISKIEQTSNGDLKKITASEDVLNYLDEWLKRLTYQFKKCEIEKLKVLTEILRFLRNCTVDFITQQYIIEKTNILNSVDFIFALIVEIDANSLLLKVLLQFLINLMSSNKNAGAKIYVIFYDRVKACLKRNVHIYESSALLYYISLIKPISNAELTSTVLQVYCTNAENEFLIFFLENNICDSNFWATYVDFKTEHKVMILETLKNMQIHKKLHNLPLIAVEVLMEEFLKSAGSIFYTSETEDGSQKAYEVSLLLEILSSLSSDESYLKNCQNNRNILINAGALLINIHKLGKQNDNCFTPVQKLSEFGTNSGLNEHPAFGFKADLIRLIGNLCWKNIDMQDLARTAELIPVILDCCNMDARNPFIIQWSILAVRNLCENNIENQKIIAGLHQEGTISSEKLNEMGMALHSDGQNELKIVSLDSLKKL